MIGVSGIGLLVSWLVGLLFSWVVGLLVLCLVGWLGGWRIGGGWVGLT